jgi:hypothetical protein
VVVRAALYGPATRHGQPLWLLRHSGLKQTRKKQASSVLLRTHNRSYSMVFATLLHSFLYAAPDYSSCGTMAPELSSSQACPYDPERRVAQQRDCTLLMPRQLPPAPCLSLGPISRACAPAGSVLPEPGPPPGPTRRGRSSSCRRGGEDGDRGSPRRPAGAGPVPTRTYGYCRTGSRG